MKRSKVKFKIIPLFLFFLFFSGSKQQTNEPVFGVAFGYNNMNELYHLVAYVKVGSNLTNRMILRRDQFIYYFSGHYPSRYNPTRINYFDKYKIFGGVYIDSITGDKIPYCPALDSLWKVRYSEFPMRGGDERFGWSKEPLRPSANQMNYLKQRYDIKDITNEYIIDKHFIQLLQDLTDDEWIREYKNL